MKDMEALKNKELERCRNENYQLQVFLGEAAENLATSQKDNDSLKDEQEVLQNRLKEMAAEVEKLKLEHGWRERFLQKRSELEASKVRLKSVNQQKEAIYGNYMEVLAKFFKNVIPVK